MSTDGSLWKRRPYVRIGAGALNEDQFDAVVDKWNRLGPSDRRRVIASCKTNGHDYRTFGIDGSKVCRHCCTYIYTEG